MGEYPTLALHRSNSKNPHNIKASNTIWSLENDEKDDDEGFHELLFIGRR